MITDMVISVVNGAWKGAAWSFVAMAGGIWQLGVLGVTLFMPKKRHDFYPDKADDLANKLFFGE